MLGSDYLLAGDLPLHRGKNPLLFLIDELSRVERIRGDVLDLLQRQLKFGLRDWYQIDLKITQ